MRVVLDTNVWVSQLISPRGNPARVFDMLFARRFELVVSPRILSEYRQVLTYQHIAKRLHSSRADVDFLLENLEEIGIMVDPTNVPRVVPEDSSDDTFLAAALAGEADFIISGDQHLLALRNYRGIAILSPAVFVAYMKTQG